MDATSKAGSQTTTAPQSDQRQKSFKSPRRILMRSFLRSRERWKAKYMAQKPKLKRLRNRAADAARARDGWRERAETAEAEAAQLRTELAASQARLAELTAAQKKAPQSSLFPLR
jgi:chromosome segregation ATPase